MGDRVSVGSVEWTRGRERLFRRLQWNDYGERYKEKVARMRPWLSREGRSRSLEIFRTDGA